MMILYFAALLLVFVGLVHSYCGERYILIRLFRRGDLPKLFGGTEFTTRTLRFAWHITTIAWWGFAAILIQFGHGSVSQQGVAWVVAATFLATALLTLVISRARHLAWIAFLLISGAAFQTALGRI